MEQEMYDAIETLEQHPVFRNFLKICQIPHPSFHEKQLSDYIVDWAGERGLEAAQDKQNNVLIRKPGTQGRRQHAPVLLQAHLDMVPVKSSEVAHDFLKDPIPVQLDGDLLNTGGKTTLGADNGIGVAYAMAVLEAADLSHPPLEVLFTTAEEEDMSGALQVDPAWFRAKQLINLDNAVEREVIAGSCGGMGVKLHVPVRFGPVPKGFQAFEVTVSGLQGGHSGEDIHRGRGNAILMLGRILYACSNQMECCLADVSGGNFRLAIPREARVVLVFPAQEQATFSETIGRVEKELKQEYAACPDLSVAYVETNADQQMVGALEALPQALYLLPNGIAEMNGSVNVVSSSCNLGELRVLEDALEFVLEIRAAEDSARTAIYQKIEMVSEILEGAVSGFAAYPGWSYNPDSPLRKRVQQAYQELFGEPMETLVVHCGLECGCLADKIPGLDAVSIGPDGWSLHSPSESLSVSSTLRVYKLLCEVLKRS